ncbi:MAG TPA: hypothetical protein VJ824_06090 [Bacillota bacterium]|nr:hypothetical protein [Bacillota bacterium]
MNKQLIAPVSIIIVIALKQLFNVELTDSQVEQTINVLAEVGAGIWAALVHPKGVTTDGGTNNTPQA